MGACQSALQYRITIHNFDKIKEGFALTGVKAKVLSSCYDYTYIIDAVMEGNDIVLLWDKRVRRNQQGAVITIFYLQDMVPNHKKILVTRNNYTNNGICL